MEEYDKIINYYIKNKNSELEKSRREKDKNEEIELKKEIDRLIKKHQNMKDEEKVIAFNNMVKQI